MPKCYVVPKSGLKEINIYIGESERKSVFCEMDMF